ncbi:hypothetical protein FNV43_RR22259 [Rhamnella rubrinervis]|uniref:NB-ARC domain-containing protein n=1 Tax=Rhamnella rubrinervis TaxID=2594499 RepID=A0A8K0E1N2_9ROSA|nr:hypothetical protein FNV43_RR22259 [Rhamnella rubrinervis]
MMLRRSSSQIQPLKKWLNQLRDAICDAEDLMYEIHTEAELSELESGAPASRKPFQVPNFFSRFTVTSARIGKTTLAQLVYNDVDANKPFDIKAWVTVSQESDVFALTKSIYEAVTKKSPDSCIKQLFQLQLQLEELLRNKKFLFVFDDVWNLNYQRWSDLKRPLQSAAHGSKIIVTTRSTEIASVMGSVSEDLLQPQKNKTLEEVGEGYFKDLTSRSFFHHEYGTFSMHDLMNDLANFVSGESCLTSDGNYLECLLRKTRYLLIYGCLPSCLSTDETKVHEMKQMEEISRNKVLRTLFVLGLKHCAFQEHYKKYPEQLQAMRYLRVLSAFWLFSIYEEPHITKLLDSISSLKLLRYLDLSFNAVIKEIPDGIWTLYNLQTLLLRGCSKLIALSDSVGTLKLLRHLDSSQTGIEKLPDTIGYLKHLGHLDFSSTLIEKLPDTICDLHELHTLIYLTQYVNELHTLILEFVKTSRR